MRVLLYSIVAAYFISQSLGGPQLPSANDDAGQVHGVVDKVLKRGEGSADGVVTSTWVPPSDEDRAQIRKLGKRAVVPLDAELDSPVPFRQLIAIQLLEEVGGDIIIPSIRKGLQSERWVVVRMQSLSALRYVPDISALPILHAELKDQNALVAQRAKDLLVGFYHEVLP